MCMHVQCCHLQNRNHTRDLYYFAGQSKHQVVDVEDRVICKLWSLLQLRGWLMNHWPLQPTDTMAKVLSGSIPSSMLVSDVISHALLAFYSIYGMKFKSVLLILGSQFPMIQYSKSYNKCISGTCPL